MSSSAARLTGEWTIHAIAQHRETLMAMVLDGQHAFDASGITEMDTAGLQLLLAAQRSVALQGHELSLEPASSVVRDVLKTYGLDLDLQALYFNQECAA
jgi:anti-sigma B factor antagonist